MTISYGLTELQEVVKLIWDKYKSHTVWAFDAAMGSGKTTLIQALCTHIGVSSEMSSPTFSIINEYAINPVGKLYHIDLYRLKDAEEAVQAGVEDVLYSGCHCFVEWPSIATEIMPTNVLTIKINILTSGKRQLEIVG